MVNKPGDIYQILNVDVYVFFHHKVQAHHIIISTEYFSLHHLDPLVQYEYLSPYQNPSLYIAKAEIKIFK